MNQIMEISSCSFLCTISPSSNHYCVIRADGSNKWLACTCSTEKGMINCCFCKSVSDEMSLRNQMKKSSFYKLNLEQYWEEIYPCVINNGNKGNAILLDASDVQREVNFLGGRQVTYEESGNGIHDEFIWFRALVQEERKRKVKLGLCSVVCEGLRSLQDSRGLEGKL
ncbi:hypothetical protein CUMW_027120 [Citrus unshiu]|nr:hypothetical protein CUMW_027120 [Citrus unshiu]